MKLTLLSALPNGVKVMILVSFLLMLLWIHDIRYNLNDVSDTRTDYCISQEEQIKKLIHKANYCSVDADCVRASFPCPFGCEPVYFVNKEQYEPINTDIALYHQQCDVCVSDCELYTAPSSASCVDGICLQ